MSAFIRWVEDLPALLEAGVNETFYDQRSKDYAAIPRAMTERLNKTCLGAGTEVVHLKQKEAPGEPPNEVFVFRFGSARGKSEWRAFLSQVAALIAEDLQHTIKVLSAQSVMQRTTDGAFDELEDCAALRNGLVNIGAKARGKKAGAVLVTDS